MGGYQPYHLFPSPKHGFSQDTGLKSQLILSPFPFLNVVWVTRTADREPAQSELSNSHPKGPIPPDSQSRCPDK